MTGSTVTAYAVNSSDGSNITPALASTSTNSSGQFNLAIAPQSGPVRITVSGGSFSSEMNGATISAPGTVSLLLTSASSTVSGLSMNPLSTFVDSRTVGLLAAGGTTFSAALSAATAQIEKIYGLTTDPGTLTPDYATTGTDAANLGLILGAIINQDQHRCPAAPGGLVTALACDISDGVFDGKGPSGATVSYCSGNLPAQARLEQALAELPKVAAHKHQQEGAAEPRVSSTDPEARVMKMGDGGFRPAYNGQFAADTESRIIVGVGACNAGTDSKQLEPMLDQLERRTQRLPARLLVDGGFTNLASFARAAQRGVEVFAPLRKHHQSYKLDPAEPHRADPPAIAAYRQRMACAEGKQVYKQRTATIETVNADLKTYRGLDRLLVRGAAKVLSVALWAALTYNLMRGITMGWL